MFKESPCYTARLKEQAQSDFLLLSVPAWNFNKTEDSFVIKTVFPLGFWTPVAIVLIFCFPENLRKILPFWVLCRAYKSSYHLLPRKQILNNN